MQKFLLLLIGGAALMAIAPGLLGSGSGIGVAIAIGLMFFIVPAIGKWLLGTAVGSGMGFLAVIALALFVLNNPRACSLSQIPTGDIGPVMDVSRIGYFAESEYDQCLAGFINAEPQNQPLRTAAEQCQANATEHVNRCVPMIGEHWWTLDKPAYCRDEATRTVWRSCALNALQSYSDNSSQAIGACQGRSMATGLMRRIAGLFSGQSDASGGSTQPGAQTPNASYDTSCLVRTYNYYLGYIKKDLGCQQFTATQHDGTNPPRVIATDEAKYQACIVESLIVNVGDTGRQAAQQCQVPR